VQKRISKPYLALAYFRGRQPKLPSAQSMYIKMQKIQ